MTGPRQQVEVCLRWEAPFREASSGVDRAVLRRPAIGIGGAGDPATRQPAATRQNSGLLDRSGAGAGGCRAEVSTRALDR